MCATCRAGTGATCHLQSEDVGWTGKPYNVSIYIIYLFIFKEKLTTGKIIIYQ